MLMKGRLTINNSVCGRWLLSLFTMLLMSVAMQAEEYDLTVGGVQVTSDNAANITGTNITAGTVSFNPQTSTLTLNNVSMNGNVVSSLAALNVKLVGVSTFNIDNSDGNSHYLFYSNNSSATLTFSADELGATLQGYGTSTSINYNVKLNYWFDVAYDNEAYWSSTTTQMDDRDYCQVSKPYVIVDGSAINDANKNNPDISGVSFDLTNNKVTLSGFQRENQSYNSYSLITSNIANLNVDIQGGLNCIYLNTTKTNQEITSRGFIYTGASGQESSLNVTVAEGSKLLLSWSGQTATTNWLLEGFSQTNMALDKTKMQEAGVLAEAGVPYDYQMTISNYTPPVSYGLTVAGVEVNSENASNITGDNITAGTVSFSNGTLTLNGANIEGNIISNIEALTISIEGTNTINGSLYLNNQNNQIEGTLSFTGSNDATLTLDNSGSGSVIYNFTSVDFGGFNLATTSSPGIFYIVDEPNGNPNQLWSNNIMGYASNVTLTKKTIYPLWIGTHTSDYYQKFTQVTQDNLTNILGDGKISFDGNHTLTLSGATITGSVISGLSSLDIIVDNANTIQFAEDSATCIRNIAPGATLTLQKKQNSETASLIVQGSGLISDFKSISYSEGGLNLSAYNRTYQESTPVDLLISDAYYADYRFQTSSENNISYLKFSNENPFFLVMIGNTPITEPKTINASDNNNDDILGDVGSVTLSVDANNNYILTIENLETGGMDIVSTLPNLTLKYKGSCNIGKIISTYSNAALTFGLAEGASDEDQCFLSLSNELPWQGFSGNPTFNNKLVYIPGSDSHYIKVLRRPNLSNAEGIYSYDPTTITVDNKEIEIISFYYTIDYVDDNKDDVTTTKFEELAPESYLVSEPAVLTAYAHYSYMGMEQNSENVIGKYFGFAQTSLTATVGDENVSIPAIVPAISETDNLSVYYQTSAETIANVNDGVIVLNGRVGAATFSAGFEESVNSPFTILNDDNVIGEFTLTVVPTAPSVSVEGGTYNEAQTVTITSAYVTAHSETATIKYYFGSGNTVSPRTYSEPLIISENTILNVWVEDYDDEGNVYSSDILTINYTFRENPNLHFGSVNSSYFDNGDTQYANFGQDFDAPVVKKVDSEYQPSTDLTGLTITYSSSDENVATIDATGKLTIVGGGKTTITAQSAQTDVYAPSTAWYQLEVKPSVPQYSLEKGVYYTGEKVALMPTVDNGKTYYRIGSDGEFTEYTNSITLPKGTNKIVSYTVCGEGTNAVSSYEREVYYFVYDELTFSPVSGTTFNGTQDITITNVPTDDKVSVAVYYKLDDGDPVQYTDKITLTESARVSAYIEVRESDTYVSEPIEAEYTIRQDPALRFYTSENSYMSTGSTENISYDDEYTSPVLKGKINGEYTAELTALGITYSSSDETVATIDQTGKITIVGGGYATITATSQQTDIYSASTTNFILKVRPADPNVSLEEGAYYTGKKLTMVRIGENGTMYYSYGYKDESERTVYPEGGISLPKGCYDFYPYTRCGTNEQNIWSYGNAHRMMYVYDQPTISKDAGTYDGEIEVEITNLPESGSYNADVYYYFDDDEDHAVQYTSGSKITVNESKTLNVYIYVEGDSSKNYKTDVIKRQYVIRQDAGLAYTQNNEPVEVAEYTIGGENNEDLPELVNENGVAVTYSSEDENVATVNAQGKVTIVGIGETTIMATSAQTATLMAGEAAYTLRVYKDLNYESITVTVADATYTGEAVEPEVTVKDGTTDITELMIISYDNNVEVGDQASVTIVPNDDLEVNFYVGSRTKTFSIVTRTLEIGKDVNFASGQKWASFYTTTEDLLLPEGVMAYIVTAVGNDVATVKAINYVPKNVPVLIEKESTTMTDNTSAEGNLLQGTAESTAVSGIEGNVYVLYNGGFTRTTSGAIPAKRAYLVLEQAAGARLSIVEGEATDITSVGYDSVATDGSTYDMQGRKVESLSKKGLYIKNGRKVVIK